MTKGSFCKQKESYDLGDWTILKTEGQAMKHSNTEGLPKNSQHEWKIFHSPKSSKE